MFQYAVGRNLAEKYNTQFKLDISWYRRSEKNASNRPLNIRKFNIVNEIATASDINAIIPLGKIGYALAYRISQRVPDLTGNYFNYYRETNHDSNIDIQGGPRTWQFYSPLLNAGPDLYIDGFWQTEKYFIDIKNKILADFTLNTELTSESETIRNRIRKELSVSIHVRRGDLIKQGRLLPLQYYEKALTKILEQVDEPTFYIFSDDKDWVQKRLDINHPTKYVTHTDADTDYEDLYLMKCCNHNIIANSTFSWWAAWLNRNNNKFVITPDKWYDGVPIDRIDLIPERWDSIRYGTV